MSYIDITEDDMEDDLEHRRARASKLLVELHAEVETLTREVADAEAKRTVYQDQIKEAILQCTSRKKILESYEEIKREMYLSYEAATWALDEKERTLRAAKNEIESLSKIIGD